jgi:hypothetical protein
MRAKNSVQNLCQCGLETLNCKCCWGGPVVSAAVEGLWVADGLCMGCRSLGNIVAPQHRCKWQSLWSGKRKRSASCNIPWWVQWPLVFHYALFPKECKTGWWGVLQDFGETTAQKSQMQKSCTAVWNCLPPGWSEMKDAAPHAEVTVTAMPMKPWKCPHWLRG